MRPGRFEFMVMNNPLRRIIQEHIESEDIQPVPEKEKNPAGWITIISAINSVIFHETVSSGPENQSIGAKNSLL